ncbi:MAG: hypothetical protein HQK76_16150 [Desulfobacterales bacterium]|nr:hypothetical protein [Desulfobacterales bacterium]
MAGNFRIRCMKCGKVMKAPGDSAGKIGVCAGCNSTFVMPDSVAIENRKKLRAIIEESEQVIVMSDNLTFPEEKPFCKIIYTEANPIKFAQKRKDVSPLLDLSKGGLSFLMNSNGHVSELKTDDVIFTEIDFPILLEPIYAKLIIRWFRPLFDGNLVQYGTQYFKPSRAFNKVVDSLLKYALLRSEVWESDDLNGLA